ncbi:hypothetical protein MBANPS3_012192 [Mucor bainieri]
MLKNTKKEMKSKSTRNSTLAPMYRAFREAEDNIRMRSNSEDAGITDVESEDDQPSGSTFLTIAEREALEDSSDAEGSSSPTELSTMKSSAAKKSAALSSSTYKKNYFVP